MLDRGLAVDGQPHVLDHLPGVEFRREESLDAPRGHLGKLLLGERVEGDRTRSRPTFSPSARAISTVAEQMRADEPKATIT